MKWDSIAKKAFNPRQTFDFTFVPSTLALYEGRLALRTRYQASSRCLHLQASEQRASSWAVPPTERSFVNANKSAQDVYGSSNKRPKDDTLTDAERAIFQQIYQDAADRKTQHYRSEEGRIERLVGDTDQEQPPEEPLSTVFNRARDVIERNERTRDRPPGVLDADRRPEADPRRVPPELLQSVPILRTHNTLTRPELPGKLSSSDRQSLQLALDPAVTSSVSIGDQPSGLVGLGGRDIVIVEACSKDAIRVQGLLENATTDSEIWRVLQKAVFEPVEQFLDALKTEHERAGDVSIASLDKRKKKKKPGSQPKPDPTSELSSIRALSIASSPDKYPQLALPFAVIRANYAHHCWAAQRILRVRFPRSPYAPAVLPKIKALGPISYVLGASTQLYNELLFLRWAHYRDLQACADLLAEMLNRGIPTDVWTRAVFRDAARRWLAARKQRKQAPDTGAKPDSVLLIDGDAAQTATGESRHQVRPFELAWWSLEGVRSGFKRWESLEIEARRRHKEEHERRERALRDAEDEENEGEESVQKAPLRQMG